MNRVRVTALGAITVTTALIVSGCAAGSPENDTSSVVFALTSRGVSSLDPLSDALATNNAYTLDKILEPLVELQPDGSIEPLLAESYEVSDDGLTWTFALRDGVLFSDESEFDSADVLYSFERHLDVGGALPIAAPVASFDAPDALTFVVELTAPYAALLADFATFAYTIVPEDLNGLDPEEFFEDPVGTGPFQVKTWDVVSGEITLERNEHYWVEGQPGVDEIEFVVVQDNNQLVQQLLAGQVDIADNVPSSRLAEVEGSGSASAVVTPSWLQYMLAFNTVDTAFSDVHLRRAAAFAIDREALADATTNGTGIPGTTFLPSSIMYSDQTLDVPQFDLAKAEDELALSASPDGVSASLIVEGGDETLSQQAAAIQGYLGEIGIAVEIESLDSTAFWNRFGARDYELAVVISTSDTGDPSNLGGWQLTPTVMDSYHTGYNNPEVVDLLQQALAVTDADERASLYSQVQQIVADDSPAVPLVYKSSIVGVRDGVSGLVVLPNGTTRLGAVTVTG